MARRARIKSFDFDRFSHCYFLIRDLGVIRGSLLDLRILLYVLCDSVVKDGKRTRDRFVIRHSYLPPMKSDNHYEAAFEWYLRGRGIAVVPIVEARRSYLDSDSVKSPDFIVVGQSRLVVDVKGRQFPSVSAGKPRITWQNWSTTGDIDGLARWSGRFGDGFHGVLAFIYHVLPSVVLPDGTPDLFAYRD